MANRSANRQRVQARNPASNRQPGAAPPPGLPTSGDGALGQDSAPRLDAQSDSPLQVTTLGCHALAGLDPQALGLTYTFTAAEAGKPYPMTIRFEGRRVGVNRKSGPRDRFEVATTVDRVLPGSGRVAVTARVTDLVPGQWRVVARATPGTRAGRNGVDARRDRAGASTVGATAWAPFVQVRAPGVRIGAWPGLVTAGAAVALGVQAGLASHLQLPVLRVLLVSLLACVLGVAGAKLYYLVLHPEARSRWLFGGMCIQGFVLAAVGALALGSWAGGVPVGTVLDVTAPGLLLGMTIGRFGCFFGGCCAGRPTASRWGMWSSDRQLGVRRIPTQLLESALAGALGVAALLLVADRAVHPAGVVFVGAIAAYTLGRQLLFPLRGLPRQTRHGRLIVLLLAAAVLVADVIAAALG